MDGQGAISHATSHRGPDDPCCCRRRRTSIARASVMKSLIPPQVAIGGRAAEVLSFGKAPGLSSVSRVTVRVPGGIPSGPAVPVRLTYIGRPSNEVTIAVQP
jgi:uncharacterized protein (TIGR03437 family)